MSEAPRTRLDTVHQQAMRELIVKLCRAYGVKKDLSMLDNTALKLELEKAVWGIK